MKIIHVAKMTGVAGMENHLLALLPGLRQRGYDVRLIVLTEPDKPMDAYMAHMAGQDVLAEPVIIRRDVDYPLIGRLAARFRAERPDAVHTHLIHADWHGVVAARRAGVPRIFWSGHNDDPFRYRLPIRLIQAYLWRRVTAGIAISEAVRQFMIRVEWAPPDRVFTIRYGLDPASIPTLPDARAQVRAELGIASDAQVFGSVCRLIEQKGLIHALEAFSQICDRHPDAHYVIIGDGPLRPALETRIGELGLLGRVHLPGWRQHAAALMPAFDAFLMPSLWEGFGLVVIEAMAAGLPVIASRVSALPEIVIDGETGLLVPPGDATALVSAMRQLLDDPVARAQMGAAGRARLESAFSAQRMIDETAALYERFAGGARTT